MTKSKLKYKITNTTVKPVKTDRAGKDIRTAVEKVGHPVQFRDENDRCIILMPGRSRIVAELDAGLEALKNGHMVSIVELDDITTQLKAYSYQREERTADKEAVAAKSRAVAKRASAVEMGKDTHGEGASKDTEYEGARNPDGKPNFLVTAPTRGAARKQRKTRNDVVDAGSEAVKGS